MTFNEPQCIIGLGYETGEHAPGLKSSDYEIPLPYIIISLLMERLLMSCVPMVAMPFLLAMFLPAKQQFQKILARSYRYCS